MDSFDEIVKFITDLFQGKKNIPLHAPVFIGNEKKYINECIDTTFVSSVGEFVDSFEKKIEEYTGTKKAVACVSGTNALHLAMKLVGVERGDEVLTQALTFVATCNAISYIGANPVFIDVDMDTLGLSPTFVKKWLENSPLTCGRDIIYRNAVFVVTDSDFEKFDKMRTEMYKNTSATPAGQDLTVHLGLDITGSDETKIAYGTPVLDAIKALQDNGQLSDNSWITSGIRAQEYDSYYADNGSLLFIGIFLGSLFLLGTAMIIYYKQISEGYDDRERYHIMQKVGMSKKEVRQSIRSQVLLVFFLPLIMAVIHLAFAFKIITKLLSVLNLTNISLFFMYTVGTVAVFAVIYVIIYSITAREYYKIIICRGE